MDLPLMEKFARIAHDQTGVCLGGEKAKLLENRVARRQKALGLQNPRDYLAYLEGDASGRELRHFVDVVTTNYTRFFREEAHFELLSQYVQEAVRAGRRRLRVWCAAASTGEEPYSVAMTLFESITEGQVDFRVLATDISTEVLEKARQGTYPAKALATLNPYLKARYFDSENIKVKGQYEVRYRVKQTLRRCVVFRRLNLIEPPYPMKGPLDVIFCRNVMIYFDNPTRSRLIGEFERLLRPDGLLMTSHTETLTGIDTEFRMLRPSVYSKARKR